METETIIATPVADETRQCARRRALIRRVLDAQRRERSHVLAELVMVKGLMPLLMKRRNGERWSRSERIELQRQLKALGALSPYLFLLALPGSFIMFPVLAWWLDRRRQPRKHDVPSSPG